MIDTSYCDACKLRAAVTRKVLDVSGPPSNLGTKPCRTTHSVSNSMASTEPAHLTRIISREAMQVKEGNQRSDGCGKACCTRCFRPVQGTILESETSCPAGLRRPCGMSSTQGSSKFSTLLAKTSLTGSRRLYLVFPVFE